MHKNDMLKTLNSMGYSSNIPNVITQKFIDFSKTSSLPVLDIGAAFGVATIPALESGAFVIANDLEIKHLKILSKNIPDQLKKRLTCIHGGFPEDLNLEPESLEGVLISQVLHFLDGERIQEGLKKIHNWLTPGGKIFILASTPYTKVLSDFFPVFSEKKKQGELWPGIVNNIKGYCPEQKEINVPNFMNFFDIDILERILNETNFVIEEISYVADKNINKNFLLDGRENVGAIGRKAY
jgi:SAM-dependent methyltransferase